MIDYIGYIVLPTGNSSKKYKETDKLDSMIDTSTFGIEFDLDCDRIVLERSYNGLLSIKEFIDSGIFEPEHDLISDVAVPKKKLLLRGGRDPNLAESRLDFEFPQKQKGDNRITTKGLKGNAILNKETLSIEDKKLFTDIILRPDKDGDNLLFIAIIAKRTELSLLLINLISYHSRLNIQNKLYQTALHLAALTDNHKVARRLINAGVEVEMRDRFGNTALHIACRKGSLEVAESLVTAVTYQETKLNSYEIPYQPIPQNLNIRNSEGLTCLHIAVIHKHSELVNLLLSKDVNVNVIEMKAGKTCMHIAAESGNEAMVKLLLSKSRPKLSIKTFAGYTATELAHYRGYDHIVYILRCKGALAARSIDTVERKPGTKEMDYLYGYDEYDEEIYHAENEENEDEDYIILD